MPLGLATLKANLTRNRPLNPSKTANPATKAPAPASRPAQATATEVDTFGKGPATVYVAEYASSSPESGRIYGRCAIYIQNPSGADILQRISRLPGGGFVLDKPLLNTVPTETDPRKELLKVGRIPKGRMRMARKILSMQMPDDDKLGESYNSKDWVKLVLDWWYDNGGFEWEEKAESKMKALTLG